jgi:hypothetical protein
MPYGIFVGAGPYLAMRGALTVDDRLVDLLGSDTDVYLPSAALPMTSDTRGEVALAITGGYRGRFALPMGLGSGGDREGLYFAFNYSYLRGFLMEDATTTLRLDTCPAPAATPACGPGSDGLLTVNPALAPPIVLSRRNSSEGRGRAIDFGVAAVGGHWEGGVGVRGVANVSKWTGGGGTD